MYLIGAEEPIASCYHGAFRQSVNSFLIKVKAFQSKASRHWRGSTLYGNLKEKIK